jgi:hypothetical protein
MAKALFGASSSIAKLYHAKFDDVATGLHRREIISSSAITSVFAQLSSKMSPHDGARRSGSEMVFGWFASERRERRRKVRLDREHLEPRARRFLKIYLNADETRKPEFYQAVQEASEQCRPSGSSLPPLEMEDAQVAEAASSAAMQIVLERSALNKGDRNSDFVTDACATVAVAYHRAAGVYIMDKEMQELGTAAVHLLTIATSWTRITNEGAS